MTRRLMRPSEIRPLLRLRRPVIDPIERRLGKAQTIGDLRGIARRHTPRAVFDYADGAADGEVSLQRAGSAGNLGLIATNTVFILACIAKGGNRHLRLACQS